MKTPRGVLLDRHRDVEPKLARMWLSVAAVCDRRVERATIQHLAWKLWRELIVPSRRIWAGLACVWVVIAALNLASSEPATEVVSQAKPRSGEELRALIEQRRMLAQLIGPLSVPAYNQKRTSLPGPHSECAARTATA